MWDFDHIQVKKSLTTKKENKSSSISMKTLSKLAKKEEELRIAQSQLFTLQKKQEEVKVMIRIMKDMVRKHWTTKTDWNFYTMIFWLIGRKKIPIATIHHHLTNGQI